MAEEPEVLAQSVEELRKSFFYGERSNLNFKFVHDLSDAEFGDLVSELFAATASIIDGAEPTELIDVAYRWQVAAYAGHLGDPEDFPHRKTDTPFAMLEKPLSECRLLLLTSSGHFLEGHDPRPFGVEHMTQREAEERVLEFFTEPPVLSEIPVDAPTDQIRVRHGGYPVQAARADHQVVLPLRHLRELAAEGVIGGLTEQAYSFVGATAQGHLRKTYGPQWAEMAREVGADAALLVPI